MRFFIIIFIALCFINPYVSLSNTIRPGQPESAPEGASQPEPAPANESRQSAQEADNQPVSSAGNESQPESQQQSQEENSGQQSMEPEDEVAPAVTNEDSQEKQQAQGKADQQEQGNTGEETQNAQAQESMGQTSESDNSREKGKSTDTEEAIAINAIGNMVSNLEGEPLVLPESSDNMEFLNGEWLFDKELKSADGENLRWNFSSKNGKGVAVLKDNKNNTYEASFVANLEDGVLRMRTDRFTSSTSPNVYNSEYIECRNGMNGAVCKGSDGFGEWSGERIFRSQKNIVSAAPRVKKEHPQRESAPEMSELAPDGPEIPQDILQKTQKATRNKGKSTINALAGHWRYSQDLARKADGEPVIMEFHFDENGKGYSVIREGGEGEFRADASAMEMPDGKLRVRTDSYLNGSGKGYYPTFMECKASLGAPLSCNLSNGWMHSDNGTLVDINSYQSNVRQTKIEDLMPTSQEENTAATGLSMEDLIAQAAEEAQSAAESQAQQQESSSKSESLVLPKKGDSVAFMEGNWICHTGLANTKTGEPVVVSFSFDKNGKGQGTIRESRSGKVYRATAQASFRNGTLRVNTSPFRGKTDGYEANGIVCRDKGGVAQCTGKNAGIVWKARFERK